MQDIASILLTTVSFLTETHLIMDLTSINSPSDLLKANKSNPMLDLIDQIHDLGPEAALMVAQLCTSKLHTLHTRMAQRDDVKNPLAWAQDAGILEVAMNCLNNIQL